MSRIFNQLPEALPFKVFMCQSSFGKRKLTSCSGFIFLKVLTASFDKNNIFLSSFGALKYAIGTSALSLDIHETFGFFWLWSIGPFLPLPIYNYATFNQYKIILLQSRSAQFFNYTHIWGGVLLPGLYLPNELAGVTEPPSYMCVIPSRCHLAQYFHWSQRRG